MDIKIEKVAEGTFKTRLSTLGAAHSIERLAAVISEWVNDERSVIVASSRDDDGAFLDAACIVFRDGDSDVAEFSISNESLFASIPQLKEILPSPLAESLKAGDRLVDEDDFFDKREETLGGEYNEELSLSEHSLVNAVAIAFSYAATGQGETYLSAMEESYLEDIEDNPFEPGQIISVAAAQINTHGFMRVDNFFCLKVREH